MRYVQDFSFETQWIDDLPPMLGAAIRVVVLPNASPGRLRVETREFEHHACPAIPLAMYCYFERHPRNAAGYLPSMEAYSVEGEISFRRKPQFYEPICTITGEDFETPSLGVDRTIACADEAATIAAAMSLVKAADPKVFLDKCGRQGRYHGCEGIVVPGYRISLAGWGVMTLTISFCHFYAPK